MRDWLIAARHAKGMTQKAVSEAVGVAPPTYWEYEHGQTRPTPEIAQRIAAVLDIPWTQFYE